MDGREISSNLSVFVQCKALGNVTHLRASLVWGHEKTEFEDDQGWQWRHPDIVSAPLAIVETTQILIYIILSS